MADSPRPRKKPAPKKKPAVRKKTRAKRKSAGRPAHVPTPQLRAFIFGFALVGTAHDEICEVIRVVMNVDISPTTLRKHYVTELELGRERAKARVARAIYNAAIKVETDPRYAQIAIFYAKTQIGWRERERMDDLLEGAIRDLDNAAISDEDKAAIRVEMEEFLHELETTGRSRR